MQLFSALQLKIITTWFNLFRVSTIDMLRDPNINYYSEISILLIQITDL